MSVISGMRSWDGSEIGKLKLLKVAIFGIYLLSFSKMSGHTVRLRYFARIDTEFGSIKRG